MRAALLALSMIALALPAVAGERPEGTAVTLTRAFPSLTPIYLIPGVRDNGGLSEAGVATSVHCLNTTVSTKQIRVVVRGTSGTVVAVKTYDLNTMQDFTASTHPTQVFAEDSYLSSGLTLNQGSIVIFATSPNIVCTAMIVDAASTSPDGIALHMMRFNPAPGSQE